MPAPPEESEPAIVRAIAVMRHYRPIAQPTEALFLTLSDLGEGGEPLQQPDRDQAHGIGEEQDAGEHEEAAHDLLDGGKMRPEALHGADEGLDGDSGEDERDAQPERVDEQKENALADG